VRCALVSDRGALAKLLLQYSAATVARPLAISPMICVSSGLQVKCRDLTPA